MEVTNQTEKENKTVARFTTPSVHRSQGDYISKENSLSLSVAQLTARV